LPTAGVESCLENFVIASDKDGVMVGVAGFELCGHSCLIRSVAVDDRLRRQGLGRSLVNAVLRNAKAKGVQKAYLLTETAAPFFERLGFRPINRNIVHKAVKASTEFTELCPESATAMFKQIE